MPFYEYQCKNCGHALEAMQKISDAPLKKCPECGKAQLQRLMSAPVFRLKGGGWYETDFKGDQDHKRNLADRAEPDAKDDKKSSAADAKKDDGKAADKPADKPAEKSTPSETVKKPAATASGSGKRSGGLKPAKKAPKKTSKARKTR